MGIALDVVVVMMTLAGAVAFLALMFWGARQDGREQRRLDRRLRQRR